MNIDYTTLAIHGAAALAGGISRAIKKKKNRAVEYIACGLVSSFSGVMFAAVFKYFYPNADYLCFAVAGIGGWAGSDGIEYLYKLFKNILENSVNLLK